MNGNAPLRLKWQSDIIPWENERKCHNCVQWGYLYATAGLVKVVFHVKEDMEFKVYIERNMNEDRHLDSFGMKLFSLSK